MSAPPRTSSQEVFDLFTRLGLEVTLDAAASAELDVALQQAADWYAEPERARSARVFSLHHRVRATCPEDGAPRSSAAPGVRRRDGDSPQALVEVLGLSAALVLIS